MQTIKQIRQLCKVTQTDFSRELGLNQSNYCNIEHGRLTPSNIDEIREKSKEILRPKLAKVLEQKESELAVIKALCEYLKN